MGFRLLSAKTCALLLVTAMAVLASCLPALAQEPVIRVATRILPPFVIRQDQGYGGFSIELMQQLALSQQFKIEWVEVKNITEILDAVATGRADAAIGAISITSEREQKFDFTQPMFESGLQIITRSDNSSSAFGLGTLRRILSTGALPAFLLALAGLVLIPAHVVWLAERKNGNPLFAINYIPGIFHAMWWAVGAAAGQQPDIPRSGLGRLLSAISILVSVIFMAFFTAALTASVTVSQMQGSITGITDLPGKHVVTTRGSTSAAYLRDNGTDPIEVDSIDRAFEYLDRQEADAVVFDAPVLLYYAANAGKGKVRVVGPIMRRENYGILMQKDSPLRKKLNAALLQMHEDGAYQALYQKWFADAQI